MVAAKLSYTESIKSNERTHVALIMTTTIQFPFHHLLVPVVVADAAVVHETQKLCLLNTKFNS